MTVRPKRNAEDSDAIEMHMDALMSRPLSRAKHRYVWALDRIGTLGTYHRNAEGAVLKDQALPPLAARGDQDICPLCQRFRLCPLVWCRLTSLDILAFVPALRKNSNFSPSDFSPWLVTFRL